MNYSLTVMPGDQSQNKYLENHIDPRLIYKTNRTVILIIY